MANRYQYGLDRGRLFVDNGPSLPWTGLAQVEDKRLDTTTTPLYDDGVKYDILSTPIATGLKVVCYSYPSALDSVTGFRLDSFGILYDEQPLGFFSFAYRIMTEKGYKIVVIFNVMASPSNLASVTMDTKVDPQQFTFDGECVPTIVNGRRVARMEFDSTKVSSSLMDAVGYALDNLTMAEIQQAFYTFNTERELIDKLRAK